MIGGAVFIRAPDRGKMELVERTVAETFDELFSAIAAKTKLHSSEQYGREKTRQAYGSAPKIYDFINSYHAFCRLCDQHFYSRSVAGDINSFFQKHLNTPYHRMQHGGEPYPDDAPMFTWEDPLHRGRCNLCRMSGINAFIISSNCSIGPLMHQHPCVWPRVQRCTNEKVVRRIDLLRKYCALRVHRNKFIRTVKDRTVCLLCGVRLPWPKEKAVWHLRSDEHFRKFSEFIWINFNFFPKDALNGFNLEAITRLVAMYEPPILPDYAEHNEVALSYKFSNNSFSPYPPDSAGISFCPIKLKCVLQDIYSDFMYLGECLLCNVRLHSGHFASPGHSAKASLLTESSFRPEKYLIYLRNRQLRLRPYARVLSAYLKLHDEFRSLRPPSPVQERPAPPAPDLPLTGNYFQAMLAKKLALVDQLTSPKGAKADAFCHVCDLRFWRQEHLDSDEHKAQLEKWNELRENSANPKFFEPFKRVQEMIACLLCGVAIRRNSIFSHMKGTRHTRRLQVYCTRAHGVPISEAFAFEGHWSCRCTVCDAPVSTKWTLKATLKDARRHWPCPNGPPAPTHPAPTEDTPEPAARQSPDGDSVHVKAPDASLDVTLCQENSDSAEGEVSAEASLGEQEESSCELDEVSVQSPGSVKEGWEEDEAGEEREMEGKKRSSEEEGSESDECHEEAEEKTHEVLLLNGLPKRKLKYNMIYSRFEKYGKINYVFFDSKAVVVAFAEEGVAEKAGRDAPVILQEPKLGVVVTERRLKGGMKAKEEEVPTLEAKVASLLQRPDGLMAFALQLVSQALVLSDSPTHAEQEQMVCHMIVNYVKDIFPLCRCFPFGSRLTGLSLMNSDMDIFVDCGGMYEGFKCSTPSSERKLVRKVAGALRKAPEVSDLIVVDSARVPIVTFLHKPTSLHCDISFKSGLSIHNSLLIKFLAGLDWRVRPLILFLKHWAQSNGLHGQPHFSSYALYMLVINYLEQLEPPVLPTIEGLQGAYMGPRISVGGWDCSFVTNRSFLPKLNNIDPVPVLLKGLFHYYSVFDFSRFVIFPLNGRPLPRDAFSEAGKWKLPMSFKRHIINIPFPIENLVSDKFPICILDPFDLSHVLTRSFTPQGLQKFVKLCQQSRDTLSAALAAEPPQQ